MNSLSRRLNAVIDELVELENNPASNGTSKLVASRKRAASKPEKRDDSAKKRRTETKQEVDASTKLVSGTKQNSKSVSGTKQKQNSDASTKLVSGTKKQKQNCDASTKLGTKKQTQNSNASTKPGTKKQKQNSDASTKPGTKKQKQNSDASTKPGTKKQNVNLREMLTLMQSSAETPLADDTTTSATGSELFHAPDAPPASLDGSDARVSGTKPTISCAVVEDTNTTGDGDIDRSINTFSARVDAEYKKTMNSGMLHHIMSNVKSTPNPFVFICTVELLDAIDLTAFERTIPTDLRVFCDDAIIQTSTFNDTHEDHLLLVFLTTSFQKQRDVSQLSFRFVFYNSNELAGISLPAKFDTSFQFTEKYVHVGIVVEQPQFANSPQATVDSIFSLGYFTRDTPSVMESSSS